MTRHDAMRGAESDAAAFVGCQVAAIANSLVFECDGEPLLIMSSGAGKVDIALVAKAVDGAVLKQATPRNYPRSFTPRVAGTPNSGWPPGRQTHRSQSVTTSCSGSPAESNFRSSNPMERHCGVLGYRGAGTK